MSFSIYYVAKICIIGLYIQNYSSLLDKVQGLSIYYFEVNEMPIGYSKF